MIVCDVQRKRNACAAFFVYIGWNKDASGVLKDSQKRWIL